MLHRNRVTCYDFILQMTLEFLLSAGVFDADDFSKLTFICLFSTFYAQAGGGGGQWRKMANNGEKWRKMAMANSAFSFVKFAIFRQFLILEFHI